MTPCQEQGVGWEESHEGSRPGEELVEAAANRDRRALPSGERETVGLMKLRIAMAKNEKSEPVEMLPAFLIWAGLSSSVTGGGWR